MRPALPDIWQLMSERTKEPFIDLPNGEELSPDELDSQVQRAQEQLVQLRRQQDAIEKQKRELEELSRKQDEFERGRTEMVDKISRSLVVIERETYEAEKRVEQLKTSAVSLSQHLRNLERINPKNWPNSDLHKELSKALSAVDDARADYNKSVTKINADAESEVLDPSAVTDFNEFGPTEELRFGLWFKRGLAFTLPLILFGALSAIILVLVHLFTR
jgi:chromosome segregation ATPase